MNGYNTSAGSILSGQNTNQSLLRLEFVSKQYQTNDGAVSALSDINLSVQAGDFLALMGLSGSGKTTLLNIFGLLDLPTSGAYSVAGQSTNHLSQTSRAQIRRDTFGFVFQHFNLLDRYTVLQNIELAMMYRKTSAKATRALAFDLLSQLGLASKAGVRPHQLSGGQAQRIAIARALIHNPRVILADEPTGNLDPAAAQEITQLLRTLNSKGTTIIMVTHSQEVASAAKTKVTMESGKIISTEGIDV